MAAQLSIYWLYSHTCPPSHIPRDCPAKISGVPLSRSRALLSRVRLTLLVTACAGSLSKSAGRNEKVWEIFLQNPCIFDMCRKNLKLPYILPAHEQVVPETSYILPEIPAHVRNSRHIPIHYDMGFLFKIDSVCSASVQQFFFMSCISEQSVK